jgi:hypothetical protein
MMFADFSHYVIVYSADMKNNINYKAKLRKSGLFREFLFLLTLALVK